MRNDATEAYDLAMDTLLRIRTLGRDESHADLDHNPYEPTPYVVLERLANSGFITKRNTLVDYGCGKGRVGFFLTYQLRCHSLGIECDRLLYESALRNLNSAAYAKKISFELADASEYIPPIEADRFFFFNPFSAEIFQKSLTNIAASLRAHPREGYLFIYYPDETFLSCLASTSWFKYAGEISCRDLFDEDDSRERIVIYQTAE